MTEKETGNAQPGACVDVLPRCYRGLLGYTDREESANEKKRKEGRGLLLSFLSPLKQESDA